MATTELQEQQIKAAQEKLAELIRSDFARIERMKADQEVTDFSKLETITIGVMPGDGIGPIIMAQARRVLEKLLADGRVDFIFPADYREGMELDRTVRDILRKMTITDRLLEVNNRQLRSIGGDVLPNQVGLF